VSISHAGAAPPPRLLALHVPHRDRCGDAPPEPRDRDLPRPPPRSGTATTPPLPGCGRPIAPAGMEHALAWLAGPAGSGGSGDRGAPGQSGVGSQRGAVAQPFSNCPSPNHACKFPSTWLSRTSCQSCHQSAPHGACDDTQSRESAFCVGSRSYVAATPALLSHLDPGCPSACAHDGLRGVLSSRRLRTHPHALGAPTPYSGREAEAVDH
jgi:hypothetical protein